MHFDEVSLGPLSCLVFRPETRADAPVLVGVHGRGQGPEQLTSVCEALGAGYIGDVSNICGFPLLSDTLQEKCTANDGQSSRDADDAGQSPNRAAARFRGGELGGYTS